MSTAYALLKVNEEKEDANPPSPNQRFIRALQRFPYPSFQRENPWGASSNINLCVLCLLVSWVQFQMATAGLVSAKAKSVLNSGVIPILPKSLEQQKKNARILSLSWLWIRPSLDSACLKAALILTLLRHDDRASKYKACEKWQIRVGQISHLLKDKDTIFARRTPKINLILQIINKKCLG